MPLVILNVLVGVSGTRYAYCVDCFKYIVNALPVANYLFASALKCRSIDKYPIIGLLLLIIYWALSTVCRSSIDSQSINCRSTVN